MLPPFDLQGGAALALARGATVCALLSAFGASLFLVLVAPKAAALMPQAVADLSAGRLRRLVRASSVAGLVALVVWLVVQAAAMADADSLAAALAAVPTVLGNTLFGHVVVLQFLAMGGLTSISFWPGALDVKKKAGGMEPFPQTPSICLGFAFLALCLQAGHGHAFSMWPGPSVLLGADLLHLAGAGAWLGGLVPLLMVVRMAPPRAAATAARWFSPLGKASVAALVVSAALQGWVLVGSIPGLVGTAYGWLIMVKLGLFAVLLGFAWGNRYRFAPALLHGDQERARTVLARSIGLQTLAALAIVAAAVVLSDLPPAMHLQPVWPFAQRPSLAAVQEDPDFRREVVLAAAALGAAAVLLLLAVVLRRLRLAAAGVAAVVAWFAVPHFDLLLVPAYPTSFYRSTSGFTADAIVQGRELFAQNCVACHGAGGAGDGPAARGLPVPPADLTAAHLWMHSDGELFWWLSHGILTPENVQAMPGFADTLDEDARWALIDYIRAHNAGTAMARDGAWPLPVHAPDMGIGCGGRSEMLSDLRGHFVRLVVGAVPPMAGAATGVKTVLVDPPAGPVPDGVCVARDETAAQAYGVITGLADRNVAGLQVLIDAEGWLRAMQAPAAPPGSGAAPMGVALAAPSMAMAPITPTGSMTTPPGGSMAMPGMTAGHPAMAPAGMASMGMAPVSEAPAAPASKASAAGASATGAVANWNDPAALMAEVRSLRAHRIAPAMTGMASMPMKMPM